MESSSEPTGWDGDKFLSKITPSETSCSEPTGWDGDAVPRAVSGARRRVPSPLGGMETSLSQHLNIKTIKCSEPTGWDGDISHHLASFKD